MAIGAGLYFWQFNHSLLLLVGSIVVSLLFLVTLFLVHQKRAGVIVIHLGLILLLIGEGITSGAAKESRMQIEQGTYANYSVDIRNAELAVIDTSAWEVPAIFTWLQRSGNIPRDDMMRTFNMGIGLIIVTGRDHVESLISELAARGGRDARVIGEIVPGEPPSVSYL